MNLNMSMREMKSLSRGALKTLRLELVDEVEYLEEEWMDCQGHAGTIIWDEWNQMKVQLNRCRYLLGELKS
jgi:hypothetical protein